MSDKKEYVKSTMKYLQYWAEAEDCAPMRDNFLADLRGLVVALIASPDIDNLHELNNGITPVAAHLSEQLQTTEIRDNANFVWIYQAADVCSLAATVRGAIHYHQFDNSSTALQYIDKGELLLRCIAMLLYEENRSNCSSFTRVPAIDVIGRAGLERHDGSRQITGLEEAGFISIGHDKHEDREHKVQVLRLLSKAQYLLERRGLLCPDCGSTRIQVLAPSGYNTNARCTDCGRVGASVVAAQVVEDACRARWIPL